jgi:hypothetical protein
MNVVYSRRTARLLDSSTRAEIRAELRKAHHDKFGGPRYVRALWNRDVADLKGVGPTYAAMLERNGVRTISDFASTTYPLPGGLDGIRAALIAAAT